MVFGAIAVSIHMDNSYLLRLNTYQMEWQSFVPLVKVGNDWHGGCDESGQYA
jgi:hypothetical protein